MKLSFFSKFYFAFLTITIKINKKCCILYPFISKAFALLRETVNVVKVQSDVHVHGY